MLFKKKKNQMGQLDFVLDKAHSSRPNEFVEKSLEANLNTSNTANMVESDEILTGNGPTDFDIESLFV